MNPETLKTIADLLRSEADEIELAVKREIPAEKIFADLERIFTDIRDQIAAERRRQFKCH